MVDSGGELGSEDSIHHLLGRPRASSQTVQLNRRQDQRPEPERRATVLVDKPREIKRQLGYNPDTRWTRSELSIKVEMRDHHEGELEEEVKTGSGGHDLDPR